MKADEYVSEDFTISIVFRAVGLDRVTVANMAETTLLGRVRESLIAIGKKEGKAAQQRSAALSIAGLLFSAGALLTEFELDKTEIAKELFGNGNGQKPC